MPNVNIDVLTLKAFMKQTFLKLGVPTEDTETIVDVLISSDLRGIESHGIGRLKMYVDFINAGVQKPVTEFEIVRESPGTALVDGHSGMGHVIAYKSMQLAIEKAKAVGIAAVAVRESTHFGIAGYYPLMAVKENMAGLAVTNARPSIAPTFGNDPMLGTNPIAFGVPTDEECPFLLDMATSIVQRGKIEILDREGKAVHNGWAIDTSGHDVSDATALLTMFGKKAASLLPLGGLGEDFAGYKGYGLAMMVEILSSAFGGGPFGWGLSGVDESGKKVPNRLGHFFMAMDISKFVDLKTFRKITGDLVRSMRASGKLPGQERIYSAGEKEFDNEQTIPHTGIPINESLQKTMKALKAELGVEMSLPF
jgi:L-2-hydroxycarboxylate dehydrogenase (NAD+)